MSARTARGVALRGLLLHGVLTVAALLAAVPFALVLLTAFKTQAELARGILRWPEELYWGNFAVAWAQGHLGPYFVNSLVVALGVVPVSVALSVLTGYAVSLMPERWHKVLLPVLLLGPMVPLEALVVPLHYGMRSLGLLNTYWALILPQIGLSLSFGTYLMAASLSAVPPAYVEAAVLDGAGRLAVLWRVLVPLVRPALQALTVFLFIWTWNEFLLPLVLVTQDSLRTLPVGMAFFQGRYTVEVPVLAAGAAFVAAPLLVVYVAFQRSLVQGLTSGGLRG